MGIEIMYDQSTERACLYDNTSDWTITCPVIEGCDVCGLPADDMAEEFLEYLGRKEVRDIRLVRITDLAELFNEFTILHNEHLCPDCEGTGNVMDGPNEVTCGACGGAKRIGGRTHEDEAIEAATKERIR